VLEDLVDRKIEKKINHYKKICLVEKDII
jgi:hypothetical protein